MPRFFVPKESIDLKCNTVRIEDEDARHISRSLRMAAGEHITVCDGEGTAYDCELTEFLADSVICRILGACKQMTEPPFKAMVYQALPKGDKLDTVIQKSIECGAYSLTTFESEFCIAKEKADSVQRKLERRRRIALEAAKQCGRGIIPEIHPTVDFITAIKEAARADIPLFCYEGEGTVPLATLLRSKKDVLDAGVGGYPTISVVIGSEGGFSPEEAKFAKENGMLMAGLGGRILRSETVAGFVLACLVYELEL